MEVLKLTCDDNAFCNGRLIINQKEAVLRQRRYIAERCAAYKKPQCN